MKQIPQADLPEISGGNQSGTSPLPEPGIERDYPRSPFNPVYEAPVGGPQE